MKIIRAIIDGERNPEVLASYRNYRCKNSFDVIKESLVGSYREEHLFALQQALELYDTYQNKIAACDEAIEKSLLGFQTAESKSNAPEKASALQRKKSKNAPKFNIQDHLIRMVGVDLSAIPGIDSYTALKILSEVGLDVSRWKSDKQFASWLGLCPGTKISGGKRLSGKSKRSKNNAATALRMAASTLHHSHSALGAYYRRLKYRIGSPKAIRATAHKLARIIYNMIKNKSEYVDLGGEYYENQYQEKLIKNLSLRAQKLGLKLVEINEKSHS
jgi:transposase